MANYNLVVCDGAKESQLADLIADVLNASYYHLFANTPTITHASVVGDFTEASWPGYAAQPLSTWSAPSLDGAFNAFTTSDPVVVPNSDTANWSANGYYLTDGTGNLIGAAYFPTPQVLPAGLGLQDQITYTVQAAEATSP